MIVDKTKHFDTNGDVETVQVTVSIGKTDRSKCSVTNIGGDELEALLKTGRNLAALSLQVNSARELINKDVSDLLEGKERMMVCQAVKDHNICDVFVPVDDSGYVTERETLEINLHSGNIHPEKEVVVLVLTPK